MPIAVTICTLERCHIQMSRYQENTTCKVYSYSQEGISQYDFFSVLGFELRDLCLLGRCF
jgi:hypothetical protein